MGEPLGHRVNAVAGWLAAAIFVGIGGLWAWDRFSPAPTPRFEPSLFVNVGSGPQTARERWFVAVNPLCSHCREHLGELAESFRDRAGGRALAALIVDTPSRPSADTLASLATREIWWDSSQVWRRRWRHRAYGEVLVFDASGRFIRALPPGASAEPPH